jgi:hypothetical protein
LKDLIEVTPIADIYADGVACVELCGPNVRLIYYVVTGGEKVIVAKIVRPLESVKGMLLQMVAAARAGLQEMRTH